MTTSGGSTITEHDPRKLEQIRKYLATVLDTIAALVLVLDATRLTPRGAIGFTFTAPTRLRPSTIASKNAGLPCSRGTRCWASCACTRRPWTGG